MTFKLPPQPWNYDYASGVISPSDEDVDAVATVSDDLTPDECRSVGALFCAAPDILALLDEWLAPLGKLSDADVDRIHDGPHGLRVRIHRSRALVRKVRGET
jgi:hypothetical protein